MCLDDGDFLVALLKNTWVLDCCYFFTVFPLALGNYVPQYIPNIQWFPIIPMPPMPIPTNTFPSRICGFMLWFWAPTRSQFSTFIGAIAKTGLRFWAVQERWCVSIKSCCRPLFSEMLQRCPFWFTTVQVPTNWRIFGLRMIKIYLLTAFMKHS